MLRMFMAFGFLAAAYSIRLGVPSYWDDFALFNQIPTGSVAIIGIEDGIFRSGVNVLADDAMYFVGVVRNMSARGVQVLGYVPTGYFRHGADTNGQQTWTRIEAQVAAYFRYMPHLSGIFFDETAPEPWNCAAFGPEYERLRNIVKKYRPSALIAFNGGVSSDCVVNAVRTGEITVLFEGPYTAYLQELSEVQRVTRNAKAKGAVVWHMVHSAKTTTEMTNVIMNSKAQNVDLVYVTQIGGDWQNGENTYGTPPVYWTQELAVIRS